MKPTFFEICESIRSTQDNVTLKKGDPYSDFLIRIVEQNTSNDLVDTDTLVEDLRYASDQFAKALKAIEPYNETEEPLGKNTGKTLAELRKMRRSMEAGTYFGNDWGKEARETDEDIEQLEHHPFHLYQ